MTGADLAARGFRAASQGWQTPYTYCTSCQRYRWFLPWRAPDRTGVFVVACETCSAVPERDAAYASTYPVQAQRGTA